MRTELDPIRGEADYENALAELERLWGAHDPIDPPDPIEAIRFRMEQGRLTRS